MTALANEIKLPFHYAWLVMIGCGMMVCGTTSTLTVLSGSFYYPASEELGVSLSSFSFSSTMVMIGLVIVMPFVSKYLSRLIRMRIILPIIAIVCAVTFASNSLFDQLWQFYVAGFIDGLCLGFCGAVTLTSVIGNWFAKKSGFAMGFAWAITSVYMAVMSPIISNLIAAFGWRTSYVIVACISGAMLFIATAVLIRFRPEDMGLKPYGYEESSEEVAEKGPESVVVEGVPVKKAVFSKTFVFIVLVYIFMQVTSVINSLFPSYAEVQGFGAQVGAFMVSFALICDIFFNIIIGSVCDKKGAVASISIFTIIAMVSLFLLIIVSDSPILSILVAGINDSMYALAGVGVSYLALEAFGSLGFEKIYAYIIMATYAIASFGSPILLNIYEATGQFTSVFAVCIVLDALIILFAALAARSAKKLPHVEETITVAKES